jgi:hypothetical protein
MTTTARVYAGVDVSKDRLDVCVRRSELERHDGEAFFLTHDDAGIDTLVSGLLEENPVNGDPRGGYRGLRASSVGWGFGCSRISGSGGQSSPGARDFARATGRLAKTEALETPKSWHASPKPSSPLQRHFRMKRSALCKGYSLAADSLWAC